MSNFLAPPTYTDVIIIDEVSKKANFNPEWLNWFLQLAQAVGVSGTPGGAIQHNALAGLQGGGGTEFFHITNIQHSLIAGLTSNVYTPTFTNVTNVTSSTPHSSQFMSIGTTVIASGQADVTPTLAASSTVLGVSLPIASNFANTNECAGTAFSPALVSEGAAVLADATNNRAQLQWIPTSNAAQTLYYIFLYRII